MQGDDDGHNDAEKKETVLGRHNSGKAPRDGDGEGGAQREASNERHIVKRDFTDIPYCSASHLLYLLDIRIDIMLRLVSIHSYA